mmetsp:Transcript_8975/g.25028  ORF Transcript_8975/g.25028 Transcript_8975/m.25028 type:complete len:106 (-) Transcript_8975:281-598(-)
MALVTSLLRRSTQIGRISIVALHCGRCKHKVETNEGMQLFLRRHMPEASVAVRQSLSSYPIGTRKQRGIYDPALTSPPSRHVQELLNGGGIGCPRCNAVEWRANM